VLQSIRDGLPPHNGHTKGACGYNGIGTNFKPRVCNSDDRAKSEKEGSIDANCEHPDFPYKEVRISPGNWDSSIVVSTA
jgi:hypothetical protein